MNEKVKEFLEAKKEAEKKKYEKEKQQTLIKLGLFEKVYAPIVGQGHVKNDNMVLKFPVKDANTKIGDIIKVSKNGEIFEVVIDKLESKYSNEFPQTEWDIDNSTKKYYKKVPIETTDEEYEEIKKYSKTYIPSHILNPIAITLRTIATLIFIIGFIGFIGELIEDIDSLEDMVAPFLTAFFSGITILGFAEIIQLLNDIKNK